MNDWRLQAKCRGQASLTEAQRRGERQEIVLRRCKGCRDLFSPAGSSRQYCSPECRPSGGRPWTPDEVATVATMAAAGLSDPQIGRELGRSRSAVSTQRAVHRIPAGLKKEVLA